jgi:hypothetical protein
MAAFSRTSNRLATRSRRARRPCREGLASLADLP